MNNVELYIILSLLNKDTYLKYRKYVNELESSKNPIAKVLSVLDSLFEREESPQQLLPSDLSQTFFTKFTYLPKEDQEYFTQVFEKISHLKISEENIQSLLDKFKQKNLAVQLATEALRIADGVGDYEGTKGKIQNLTESLLDSSNSIRELEDNESFVTTDLTKLLDDQINAPGLNWRLLCLRESLGPLRKGDFGFVFARPETGKTTFLASELTYMLDQVPDDRSIIWFNNEEQGEKVMLRCFQAYFGITLDELKTNGSKYKQLWDERNGNKLLVFDSASITRRDVERILHKQVVLMVFDQIDKIKGFSADRRDIELGSLYSWGRELAKSYCPVIGICQAAASGENKMWLQMDDVVDAKTSKQAEADWILGIGALHDNANVRYFNLPKNKLTGGPETLPESRHGRFQVIIKPEVARYEDI